MVMIESRMPSVPAIIVPVLRLLHPQHDVNLCGFPIMYALVSLPIVYFSDNEKLLCNEIKSNGLVGMVISEPRRHRD